MDSVRRNLLICYWKAVWRFAAAARYDHRRRRPLGNSNGFYTKGEIHFPSLILRMRKRRIAFILAGGFLLTAVAAGSGKAFGGTATVFGPESYVRKKGAPVTVQKAFSVQSASDSCTLQILNGGSGNSIRVSSAVLSLNGIVVTGHADFNQRVSHIEKPVSVQLTNTLAVELMGQPGGVVEVSIICSVPMAVSVPALVGLRGPDATATIRTASLSVGTVTEELRISQRSGNVADQSPPPGTIVAEGTPVDLTLAAAPPETAGETIPDSWIGTWTFTTTYRDLSSDNVDSVVEISDAICAADPMGLALVEQAARNYPEVGQTTCSGSVGADRIEGTCATMIAVNGCAIDATTHVGMVMTGDTAVGIGSWTASNPCGLALPSEGQTFLITATRTSRSDGGLCVAPVSSWLQKFVRNPLSALFEVAP